jgi:DNA-binding response OmpR family regulator
VRLLVVEDDPRLASLISRGLREQTYAVDVVGNGKDAIVQAAVNSYDAIVLDVMLPGLDGFAVLTEIRARASARPS